MPSGILAFDELQVDIIISLVGPQTLIHPAVCSASARGCLKGSYT